MPVRPVYALLDGVGIIDTDGLQDLSVTTPKIANAAITIPKVDGATDWAQLTNGLTSVWFRRSDAVTGMVHVPRLEFGSGVILPPGFRPFSRALFDAGDLTIGSVDTTGAVGTSVGGTRNDLTATFRIAP